MYSELVYNNKRIRESKAITETSKNILKYLCRSNYGKNNSANILKLID